MNLLTSPKEALKKIDDLIMKGFNLKEFIIEDYEKERDEAWAREDEDDNETVSETKCEPVKLAPELEPFRPSITAITKQLSGIKIPNMNDSFNKKDVSDDVIDDYKKKHDSWFNECLLVLEDIYKDFAPKYIFYERLSLTKFKTGLVDPNFKQYIHVVDKIESRLTALSDFYNDLKNMVRSPLNYIEEKAQICFYEFICQLIPSTNESALCSYMFQFPVGEFRSYSDIYRYMFGDIEDCDDKYPKGWKTKITSAYDGVNRKTNDAFDFNIFTKKDNSISLHFPSRMIASL